MSQRRMARTDGADGCPRNGKQKLMAHPSMTFRASVCVCVCVCVCECECVCVCGFLSWGHPSVPFVLAFAVCETDVLEMRRKVCF